MTMTSIETTTMAYSLSCPRLTESELLAAGATSLTVSYLYELETSSSSSSSSSSGVADDVDEAIRRVRSAMLRNVAERSGLATTTTDCDDDDGGSEAWRERRGRGRRRLRIGGRGSNSVVGIGYDPEDEATDLPCRAEEEGANGMESLSSSAAADVADRIDPLDFTQLEFDPDMAGSVAVGENLDDGSDLAAAEAVVGENDLDVPSSTTRVDGGDVSVQRKYHHDDDRKLGGGGSYDNTDLLSFEFASTQSLPLERTSRTSSHDPLNMPAKALRDSSKMNVGSAVVVDGSELPRSPPTATTAAATIAPVRSDDRTCTVVRGSVRVYTSFATEAEAAYENLEGRILASLVQDVGGNDDGADYADDVVLGVRMYREGDGVGGAVATKDPSSASSGFASAIEGPAGDDNSTRASSGSSFTAPVGVLAALCCVLIALAALFVRTSGPEKKRRSRKADGEGGGDFDAESSTGGTYRDEDVELDLETIKRSLDINDDLNEDDDRSVDEDYSVDIFSVGSTKENEDDGASSPEGDNNVSYDASLVRSAFFGLFSARPRAASPESEVEMDVQSVYDCDDGVESVYDEKGGVKAARLLDSSGLSVVEEDGDGNGGESGGEGNGEDDKVRPRSSLSGLLRGRRSTKNPEGRDREGAGREEARSIPAKEDGQEGGGVQPSIVKSGRPSLVGMLRGRLRAASRDAIEEAKDRDEKTAAPVSREHNGGEGVAPPPEGISNYAIDVIDENDVHVAAVTSRTASPTMARYTDESTCARPRPRDVVDRKNTVKPVRNDVMSRDLRFFSARDQVGARTPHVEVESSLRPFEERSQYSASVMDSRPAHDDDDDDLDYLLSGHADDDRERRKGKKGARMVRRFDRIVRRKKSRDAADVHDEDRVREVCRTFSVEQGEEVAGTRGKVRETRSKVEKEAAGPRRNGTRKSSGPEKKRATTAVYTMHKTPSTLRPAEFYRSPNTASSVRTRGWSSHGEEEESVRTKGRWSRGEEESTRTKSQSSQGGEESTRTKSWSSQGGREQEAGALTIYDEEDSMDLDVAMCGAVDGWLQFPECFR